ncbi:HGL141Wp [Eremothecium sinecaudum]|uniref:RNA helicase n=1 Tax=Eremothecium sinecaudum TaxID=45286 RepID=A0A0X8HVC7_9SACH|nr:HGL141Wp [Eremothecium sinecaudum]AMD22199.1 HGL141Wp [Eremothecium sinecaudum]
MIIKYNLQIIERCPVVLSITIFTSTLTALEDITRTIMSDKQDNERIKKIREIYRYDEISNKVLKADKRLQENRTDPLKDAQLSQPSSMAGKISVKDMGTVISREFTEDDKQVASRNVARIEARKTAANLKKRKTGKNTILTDELELLNYYPTTDATKEVYEQIVQLVTNFLGSDLPHSVIVSAADLILQTLKENEEGSDYNMTTKKRQIEDDLDMKVEDGVFRDLVALSKKIHDYGRSKQSNEDDAIAIADSSDQEEEEEEPNPLLAQIADDEQEVEQDFEQDENLAAEVKAPDAEMTENNEIIEFKDVKSNNGEEQISISSVNEHYIQNKLTAELQESDSTIKQLTLRVVELISEETDNDQLRSSLSRALGENSGHLVDFFVKNRLQLLWGVRLSRASDDVKEDLLEQLNKEGHSVLVEQYKHSSAQNKRKRGEDDENVPHSSRQHKKVKNSSKLQLVDLDSISFDQGSKLLTATKISLPEESYKKVKPTYEEIHIPAPSKPADNFTLLTFDRLPKWAQSCFITSEAKTFNRIQSEVYPIAFERDSNMLLCAPTGAGKTNVAMLTILRTMSKYYNEETRSFKTSKFKIVYIAPLKALVQEQVREFQRRLQQYGIKVAELTGDSNLTKQQIMDTQILVSTPEKWDVITRNDANKSYTKLVRLIIIDEVHLLHDDRGPVIESIVARTLRGKYMDNIPRIIALSATLPNFNDVADFLNVPEEGLFYFDATYRPCPLAQQFCGITESNAVKRINGLNQACYDKVLEAVSENNQVIVFVHSRKDTARTAKWLKEKATEEDTLGKFVLSDISSKEILNRESDNISDKNLRDLIQQGFGIHHAGLPKNDRSLSEDLFADGLIKVLVSTATLAWGVNLPAHTVIIKGTDVYSPEKGKWMSLSPQDVLQMLGRAGRPRYDVNGEGIIITNQQDIHYYLAVLNQQLPIESQLISKLPDNLNAEIVLGDIKCRADVVDWLQYTYLYMRMRKSPELYKVIREPNSNDPKLLTYREILAHSALTILHDNNLIVYDADSGIISSTALGRIASHFYIKYASVAMYNQQLNMHIDQIEIFRIFASSDEFKYVTTRQEEKNEITNLLERAPIPIKESPDDPLAKINVLLQAYISRLRLDGFALNSDMIYITQNAGRLFRALFEISLRKGWPRLTRALLNMCKSIDNRMWLTNSPLRQFKNCPVDVIKRMEASALPWNEYLDLKSPAEVAQAIRSEKYGKVTYDLLHRFPKMQIECSIQPITRTLLKFSVGVIPQWIWDQKVHSYAEPFLLTVEDTNGEKVLYTDIVTITRDYLNEECLIDFTIQIDAFPRSQLPPNIFISLSSMKWLYCDYKIPVILDGVHLPRKFPPPTKLNDDELLSTSELEEKDFIAALQFDTFNKFQSQVFHSLYNGDENVFIGACKGAGKTVMAEIALMNHWRSGKGRAIYISPSQGKIDILVKHWRKKYSDIAGFKNINKFGRELSANIRILAESHLVLATPAQFDLISRKWKRRKNIQTLQLMILDDVHTISNGYDGAIYENIIARMLFIRGQLDTGLRLIGLSTSLANGRDFGEWLGAKKSGIFNFSSQERTSALQIQIQSYASNNKGLLPSMITSASNYTLLATSNNSKVLVFVPSRQDCFNFGISYIKFASQSDFSLLSAVDTSVQEYLDQLTDNNLKEPLRHGIGFLYRGISDVDKSIIENLYMTKQIKMIVVSRDYCELAPFADTVLIASTSYYEAKEHRYVNYPVIDILEMTGLAKGSGENPGKAILMTDDNAKEYYKKFLGESLPTESFMPYYLHDGIANDISTAIVESKQDCIDWITYSYFYRRIHSNPSFYGVKDTSAIGISAYLTELVEETLNDLAEIKMVEMRTTNENQNADDPEISEIIIPLNNCMIASQHGISFQTMHIFVDSLSKSTKLKSLLEILASAVEFEDIALRQDDKALLLRLHSQLPFKFSGGELPESCSFKVFVLLQAYFTRLQLPTDLKQDLDEILMKAMPLINGIVDILSGEGMLNVTTAMDISQMLVQGCWDTDSPLKQIPFFDSQILEKCSANNVETVYDIMALEEEEQEKILILPAKQLNQVANFVNNYPNIELKYSINLSSPISVNETKTINVTILRDEEPESLNVVSERFPGQKLENWWLFVGEVSTRQLYSIRRIVLGKESQTFNLEFSLSEPGSHKLSIWCVCDSYLDADKEVSFELEVK